MIVEDEPWVDMSQFEDDEDPEDAVSDTELGMLRDALAVDPTQEPSDALWEHMISSAVSGSADEVEAPEAEQPPEPVEDEVVEDPVVELQEPWGIDQDDVEDEHHEVWSEHHDHHGDGS